MIKNRQQKGKVPEGKGEESRQIAVDYRFQKSQCAEDKGACSQHAVGDFDSGIISRFFHEHAVKRIREHGTQEKKISGCRKTGGRAGGKYRHEDTAKRDQNTGGLSLRRFFF